MREIKFRYVWKRNKDNKIWMEIVPMECIEGKGDKPFILQDNFLWTLIARDRYIGLKDTNRKEIYEGDIVEFRAFSPHHDEYRKGIVEWDKQEAKFILHDLLEKFLSYTFGKLSGGNCKTIIGNIYENPKLLDRNEV